ncbi:SurA N-terminal domain-containing protein [Actinacidiphila yeochonensis]|uniref:SurA N-terminal domain-containing protein n=1 Tax=Actinacidiphila yeochonensis TaxID=89050 RepID=UPI00056C8744|nr:SurA N-terminal domain-containing protein [Actinacidiphila yeochonensis]
MVRRRTAAVSIAAAALLLASPALTACGSGPERSGAAAVVGDHRITISTLQTQVGDLRSAAKSDPQVAQAMDSTSQLPSHVLSSLVQDEVFARAAADAGVTVTAGEVDQERNAVYQQFGGRQQFEQQMLGQGIAPGRLDTVLRDQVVFAKLATALGYQPGSDGAEAAVDKALDKTAGGLHVRINPRYGTWNAKTASVGPDKQPWLVTKTQVAAAGDGSGAAATGIA